MDPETNDNQAVDKPEEKPELPIPGLIIHQHSWSKWYPYSRNQVWRQCNFEGCIKIQVKDALN